jgi:hypothetical protein
MANYDTIHNELLEIVKSADVANSAGIADINRWQTYHVFEGDGAYFGLRCRGALPFVEVIREDSDLAHENTDGGTEEQRWTIRINVAGTCCGAPSQASAEKEARSISRTILKAIKGTHNFVNGSMRENPVVGDAHSLSMDLEISSQTNFDFDFGLEQGED